MIAVHETGAVHFNFTIIAQADAHIGVWFANGMHFIEPLVD